METRFNELVSQGDSSFANREYKSALSLWGDALKIQPASVGVLKKVVQAYLRLAEFSKAEKILKQILQNQSDADDVLLELARLQLVMGNMPDAVGNWEELSSRHPKDPHVKVLHGDLLILEDRLEDAEKAYKSAVGLPSSNDVVLIKLAACYLSQGKDDMAQQTFETAVAKKIESTDVLLQIANYWKLKNNMEKVELFIQKAIQLEPEDLSLQMKLAQFYFNISKYEDSRVMIDKLITQAPENRSLKKYLIKILLAQNQLEKIPSLLESYTSEMKNDLEFNFLSGKYYLFVHSPLIAEKHFKQVVQEKPEHFLAHYFLGVTYLLSGHVYLAQQSLIKALSLNQLFSEAEMALADIFYKKNELGFSQEHIKRVLDNEPENFRAHMMMGHVLFAKKEYEKALVWFKSAVSINPDSESGVYYIALVSEQLKKESEALKLYQMLLKKNPDLADAAWRLKELWIKSGKIDVARHYFESAVEVSSDSSLGNGYLQYILGEVYLAGGDTLKAIDRFNSAIDLLPGLSSSYIKLAGIYGKNNNWEKQVEILTLCSANIPDFLDAYIKLAAIYIQKDKGDAAIKILETAVLKNSDSALLANNLASLYLEKDENINKAFELARFAYEHMPDDPGVVDSFGWAYYKKNMFVQAVNHLKYALVLSPGNEVVVGHLGLAEKAMERE
ncbi:tetratricopeptide repeat protein [Desulfobacterales bacterium HSG17]|nr:tetratricopeptide repeat protein [Desulfobacterales bacterium HSG17]